jgi:hypothetical protein
MHTYAVGGMRTMFNLQSLERPVRIGYQADSSAATKKNHEICGGMTRSQAILCRLQNGVGIGKKHIHTLLFNCNRTMLSVCAFFFRLSICLMSEYQLSTTVSGNP